MSEIIIDPAPSWLPTDADLIPASLKPLIEQRDKAFDAWNAHVIEWEAVLSANWERVAEDRDRADAAQAVAAGKNPMSGTSHMARATAERPRALAAANSLAQKVRQIDAEILRTLRAEAPALMAKVGEALDSAEEAYVKAWREYRTHRQGFGRCAYVLSYLHGVANDRFPPDYSPRAVMTSGSATHGAEDVAETRSVLTALGALTDTEGE